MDALEDVPLHDLASDHSDDDTDKNDEVDNGVDNVDNDDDDDDIIAEIDPSDPDAVRTEYERVRRVEDEELARPVARKTFIEIRNALFKKFRRITDDTNTLHVSWHAVPARNEEKETLQLYTSRDGLEETGFCYWRVQGRVEMPGAHLYLLLSDYWPRTRLSWDTEMADAKIIEEFPECEMTVVQTLRKDAPKGVRKAGGTLGLQWKHFNPVKNTWMVLFHSIRQHRYVDPSPPTRCRGMGEAWTAAHIRDNPNDGSACTLDIVTKVWVPRPAARRFLGDIRRRDEERLRQRIHLYERVQRDWFKHFAPGLQYGSDPPCNTLNDTE